jgi:hypothetical protein
MNLNEVQLIKVIVLLQINKTKNIYGQKYFKENIPIHSIVSGAFYFTRISLAYQIRFRRKKILVVLAAIVTDKYYPQVYLKSLDFETRQNLNNCAYESRHKDVCAMEF